jgi:hypothetical protein
MTVSKPKWKRPGSLPVWEKEVKSEDPPIRGFIDVILNDGTIGEIKTARKKSTYISSQSMKPLQMTDCKFLHT